jgi:nucleotide-binding universal stress UspA family protein
MNARGAMGLIVALIGLSLGLLTPEMYSTIVLVALVTSFMAPILLGWAMPRLPMTEQERLRAEIGERRALVPPGALHVLVPTAGGANAMTAIELAAPLIRHARGRLTALYVDEGPPRPRLGGLLGGRSTLAGTNLAAHFNRAAAVVDGDGDHFTVRQVRAQDVAGAVVEEARRDYDLVFLGAARERILDDPLALEIVRHAPLPVVIVRGSDVVTPLDSPERVPDDAPSTSPAGLFRRLLVPVDGSIFSRYAAELALAYAGAAGARVRVLHVIAKTRMVEGSIPVTDRRDHHAARRALIERAEEQIRQELEPLAAAYQTSFSIRVLTSGVPREIIVGESRSGDYDLLVLGTETKLLGQPFFIGQGTAEIAERAGCTTAIVLPGARGAG